MIFPIQAILSRIVDELYRHPKPFLHKGLMPFLSSVEGGALRDKKILILSLTTAIVST